MPDKDEKKPEEKPALTTEGKVEGKEGKPAPKDNLVVTQHRLRIGGKEIKYTVTTGTIVLKEEPAADLFIQRRARVVIGLAASRGSGTAAGGADRRGGAASASVPIDR